MRTFCLTAFAFAALAATAHAEELRTSDDEQTCQAPEEAEAAELRSSCSPTNDGCWYTSGCGTAHSELVSGNIEAMLNGCHIPELPDNCMWRNQVGSVDVYLSGSLCEIGAGATNDPGPATGLNRLIDQIINAQIPRNAMITGYDVLGVSPFGPVSKRGHARVHYRVVMCVSDSGPIDHNEIIVDPNPLAP